MNKILSGVCIGLFSGTVLALTAIIYFQNDPMGLLTVGIGYLAVGAIVGYGVLKRADTVAKMWVFGSIIGAIEWLLLAVVITNASLTIALQSQTTGAVEPSFIEKTLTTAGIFSLGGTGIAVFMAMFCLIISVIAQKANKEFHPEPA